MVDGRRKNGVDIVATDPIFDVGSDNMGCARLDLVRLKIKDGARCFALRYLIERQYRN